MIIGLTGGIGSGKTLCAKIFEELGVPVYYSDERAKRIMIENEKVIQAISQLLGQDAYQTNGLLNREYIASKIFSDEALLSQMNGIVHPAVRDDFMAWGAQQLKSNSYIMQESALMYETGSYRLFDKIILVDAPVEIRISRVMKRDSTTRENVLSRMSKQLPSKDKRQKADFIIENDGQQPIIPQVINLHHVIVELLSSRAS